MVLTLPALLSYSVEDNMAPKLQWLQTRLDLDEDATKEDGATGRSDAAVLGYERRGQHGAEARLAAGSASTWTRRSSRRWLWRFRHC